MNRASYEDKLDPRLFGLFHWILGIFELLEINNGGGLALTPEFYEKYEVEGCPDWTKDYDSKIKIHKLVSIFKDALPPEIIEELKKVDPLKIDKNIEEKTLKLFEKHGDKISEAIIGGLKRKRIKTLLSGYVLLHYFLYPAIFGNQLCDVIKEAKRGDHKAILKLIQVDKALIGKEWVMKEIRKAQLSEDKKFLNDIGNNIKKDAFNKNRRTNLTLSFVLVYGWPLGLKKLKTSEIHDFVTDLGVYEHEDSDSLYREIKRLELRKREPKEKKAIKATGKKTIKKAKRRKASKITKR